MQAVPEAVTEAVPEDRVVVLEVAKLIILVGQALQVKGIMVGQPLTVIPGVMVTLPERAVAARMQWVVILRLTLKAVAVALEEQERSGQQGQEIIMPVVAVVVAIQTQLTAVSPGR